MSIDNLMADIDEMIEKYIDEYYTPVTVEALGLDPRAATRSMWVSDEGIITNGSTRHLEYYGGFEYVDEAYVRKVGSYTYWGVEDERVRDHVCRTLSEADARSLRRSYGDKYYYEEDEE